MDRTGTPPQLWFLALVYCMHVLNHSSDPTLNNRQPIFVATGKVGDISSMMYFQWLEPVFVKLDDSHFPSKSTEILCYWVGIAEHVGHSMTFKVWNKKTNKILDRSTIRTALDPKTRNLRANPLADDGLVHHDFVRWLHEKETGEQSDAETGEHTSNVDDYGDPTGRPPDADDTVPAVPTGTATVVPPDNAATTSGERASTDADYGEKVTRETPTTPIVETVDDDEDIPPSDTPHDGDNDDDEENSPLWVVLTDENGQPTNDKDGKPIKFKGLEPAELQGRTFLQPLEDGTIRRGRIVAQLQDHQDRGG